MHPEDDRIQNRSSRRRRKMANLNVAKTMAWSEVYIGTNYTFWNHSGLLR